MTKMFAGRELWFLFVLSFYFTKGDQENLLPFKVVDADKKTCETDGTSKDFPVTDYSNLTVKVQNTNDRLCKLRCKNVANSQQSDFFFEANLPLLHNDTSECRSVIPILKLRGEFNCSIALQVKRDRFELQECYYIMKLISI
ncbi:uncharacterized protein LOC113238076, partial [Hyposmocoma kahamanoa]|uniref:uncharacterized protein LOC113238076 n=1 Tax=Hyposmocoma kahamanoa TaxID=1477025 RepID=UPI000E6D664B